MQSGGLWVWLSVCVTQGCCRTHREFCLNLNHSRLPRCGCSWKPSYPSCLEYGVGFLSEPCRENWWWGSKELAGSLGRPRMVTTHWKSCVSEVQSSSQRTGARKDTPPTCLPPCHHLRASLATSRLGKQSLGEG